MSTEHFFPSPALTVAFDKRLGIPVSVLGEWRDDAGRVLSVEVQTMTQPRRPTELASFAAAPPAAVKYDDDAFLLPERLYTAADQLSEQIEAGLYDALPEDTRSELRAFHAFLREAHEMAVELVLFARPPGR